MARHVTLADIGRGVSRHRAPRRQRRVVLGVLLAVAALVGAGLAVPGMRSALPDLRNLAAGTGSAPGAAPGEAPAAGRDCASGTTDLVLASSADKAALLTRFGEEFSRTGKDSAGRCIHVQVISKSSGAAMSELARGWPAGPKPDVWSPSGSIWLPQLEARLAEKQRSSLVPTPRAVPAIAASPLVIAMPRPMAEAMGWPRTAIGWSDLYRLGSQQTGWGTFGHPEWGPFLLGKTNPNFSHAGLEGTVATYYAATGRTTGLTAADVARADVRRFVAGVEQSIVRYGDNTPAYHADWRRADDAGQALSFLSALVTEENLVASYNDGNPGADPALAGKVPKPKVPLVAIYPKEGTFVADHPYAVLSAPWVTGAKRDAAAAFLAHLRSPAVQLAFQANYFRDARGRAGPRATEQIGLLPDQPRKVLQSPPAATTAAILASWAQLRKTANVISLLDVSGSMAYPVPGGTSTRLDAAKQAAIASLDLFTDHDEVGLWTFSGGARGVRDWTEQIPIGPMNAPLGAVTPGQLPTRSGENRRQVMRQALARLVARGDTGLYNSIAAAYAAVLARYDPGRINAVVVLTDGRNDAQGGLTLGQLLAVFSRDGGARPVRIITIAYGPDADQATLTRIAHATRGASYVAPGPAEIPKVYAAALSNI